MPTVCGVLGMDYAVEGCIFFAFIIRCKAHTRQVIVFFECCWLAPPFFLPPPYFAFSCGMMKRMKTFAHRNGNYNALSTMDGAPLPTGHSASEGMESGENWTRQRKCNTVLLCCWKCARAGGLISSANNNARALIRFPFHSNPGLCWAGMEHTRWFIVYFRPAWFSFPSTQGRTFNETTHTHRHTPTVIVVLFFGCALVCSSAFDSGGRGFFVVNK